MGQRRADGDEAGQVRVLGAQAVGDPRAHAGPDEVVAAGVQLEQRAAVGRVGAVDRVDDAEVVHARGHVREQLADPEAALAVLPELPRASRAACRSRRTGRGAWRTGTACRRRAWSSGLESNVSTCDGPPFMNRKITRLARGGKCGGLGASGFGDDCLRLALRRT